MEHLQATASGRHCFIVTLKGFSNHYDVAFFETNVLKEVRILRSLYSNITILLIKFQIKFAVAEFP